MTLAKVDVDSNPELARRFDVVRHPGRQGVPQRPGRRRVRRRALAPSGRRVPGRADEASGRRHRRRRGASPRRSVTATTSARSRRSSPASPTPRRASLPESRWSTCSASSGRSTRWPRPTAGASLRCSTDVRLNAWLARAGVASRRGADELIKAGRVTVNGEPGQLNTFVASRDRVELDGRPLAPQQLAYVLLNKPAGVVTTAPRPRGRPTVVGLVGHESRVVPVGRLDADTTGALLLTNDGELAHRLAHPRYEVDKVYVAEVEGEPSDETLAALERGVELEDGRTAPARARRLAPRPRRARAPRGPQAPGEADARRGRPSRHPAPPEPLRPALARRPRARRMARARAGRGRAPRVR